MSIHYIEQPAPAVITAAIECVWSVADRAVRADRPRDRVIPDGCPELIVHLAARYARVVDGRLVRQPAAFLAGTLSRPWIMQAPPRVATIGVRFRPGGLTALFGASLAGTADREVPLTELPPAMRALAGAIGRARGPASARRAAERWLVAHVASAPRRGGAAVPEPSCAAAVREIRRRRGRIGVDALASGVDLPRRRLERLFRRETALSPKQFIRVVRLTALLRRLETPDRDRLIDVALDAGYFDQAHMARDFKALTARRPSSGRATDGDLAIHFTRPDRLLRLLAAE